MKKETVRDVQAITELVSKIAPILHGKQPHIVGAVLGEIVSLFFAGHNPSIREQQIDHWISYMRDLIDINEREVLRRHGMESWQ